MGKLYFTLIKSFISYRKLKAIRKTKHRLPYITLLTPDLLQELGVRCLTLDFDGVLATHGQSVPNEDVKNWLTDFCGQFSEGNIFILSNNPTQERKSYFKLYFPNIKFIDNVRKKPYPDGLQKIKLITHCNSNEIALIDDRLLTGCLACVLADCYPILITSPFTNFKKRPFQESFFGVIRWIEKSIFSIPNSR